MTFPQRQPSLSKDKSGYVMDRGNGHATLYDSSFASHWVTRPTATAGAVDSQSRATTETPGERGYDAGKKVKGRKKHIVVDTLGLLMAVCVTAASVSDKVGCQMLLSGAGGPLDRTLQKLWADSGYQGPCLKQQAADRGIDLEIVKRSDDMSGFVVLPHRWIVERTFGWMGRYRILSKEYEKTIESSRGDVLIAMTHIMLRRLTATPPSRQKQ